MDKRVLLLKELLAREGDKLSPVRELASPFGHSYPVARRVLETSSVGKETEDLEWLSSGGYLEQHFFDRIHLCPYCSHYAINFREVCPRCKSADTGIVEMVHHFRCGAVAPEAEFRNGARFACPKCRRALRHLGVDYERPSASYSCGACGHLFVDPPVSCQCLNCSEAFDAEKATLHNVYAYSLSEKGAIAVSRGMLVDEAGSEQFVDKELAIYSFQFFKEQLDQEVRKSGRYEKSVSVMAVGPDNLSEYQRLHGTEASAWRWRDIIRLAREELRDCDIPARTDDGVFVAFFPETSLEGAGIAATRIVERARRLDNESLSVTLSIGLSGLSVETRDAELLLSLAQRRLVRAREAGGDRVESERETEARADNE